MLYICGMQNQVVRFDDIPGHEHAKATLRQLVDSGKLPHALMLSGPSGVGKMLMARALINYAHCLEPHDGEPCGHCRNCRLHAEMAHPDVHYSYPIVKNKTKGILVSEDVKPQWHRMLTEFPAMPPEQWLDILEAGNSQPAIHVEESQEIIRGASFPPYASTRKFFVIWLPERLRPETANKLLKIIEEPGEGICFILVSNNDLEVLPTIFSRTQRIRMGRLERRDIEKYLQHRWHLDENTAYRLAPLAQGCLAKADELGSNSGETGEFRKLFQGIMRDAYSRKVGNLKRLSDSMASFGREKIIRFLGYVSSMIRENYIYNLRMPQLNNLSMEDEAFSRNLAPFINSGNVEALMEETDRARRDIERNCNAKITLFDYFLLVTGLIRKKNTA